MIIAVYIVSFCIVFEQQTDIFARFRSKINRSNSQPLSVTKSHAKPKIEALKPKWTSNSGLR